MRKIFSAATFPDRARQLNVFRKTGWWPLVVIMIAGPFVAVPSVGAVATANAKPPAAFCPGTAAGDAVRLTEIMPHPAEGDEWVELQNLTGGYADVSGWFLDDGTGGSAPYALPCGTILQPHGHLTVEKTISRLALNDEADAGRLLKPDGTVANRVSYRRAPIGESYAWDGNRWRWTTVPTPGAENVWPIRPTAPTTNTRDAPPQTKPDGLEAVTGVVTLGTGIIGPNSFILLDADGAPVFVRSTSVVATTGQYISVSGKRRQYARRAWFTAANIRVGTATADVVYAEMTPGNLDGTSDGRPASLSGIVESVSGNSFRISEIKGDGTVRVRLPPGTTTGGLKRGSPVVARGVIYWQGSDIELLLASVRDFAVTDGGGKGAVDSANDENSPLNGEIMKPLIPRAVVAAGKSFWLTALGFLALIGGGVTLTLWRRKKLQEMEIVQE